MRRKKHRTAHEVEEKFRRDLAEIERTGEVMTFREVTPGGSPHRTVTPQIVGPENVRQFKEMWGVCPTPGCSQVAGHDGPCPR